MLSNILTAKDRIKYFIIVITFLVVNSVSNISAAEKAGNDSSVYSHDITDTSDVYSLGKIIITGRQDSKAENLSRCIDRKTLNEKSITDVAQAISLLPGVTLTNVSGRNERQVYLHGFNSQQIGLFIDGIPIYVPYDGNVDLARFTTFDVGEINVEKGISSILYGTNAMGGAINIVGGKPSALLDISAKTGVNSDKGTINALNIGSRRGAWYGLLSMSYIDQDYYTLSKDYKPGAVVIKKGGEGDDERNNSYHTDYKIAVKAGYNPAPGDEISLIASMQRGEKGVPPYAGADTASSRWKYWKWPYWDKNSVYLISKWQLGNMGYIKMPVYMDNFRNSLFAYSDSTYSGFKKKSAFKSWYNDYAAGSSIEYGAEFVKSRSITDSAKVNVQYKNDYHSEKNTSYDTSKSAATQVFVDKPDIHFREYTCGAGVENELVINGVWSIVPGAAFNYRKMITAENLIDTTSVFKYSVDQFPKPGMSAVDGQLAVYYRPALGHTLSASVARRTRFPNIKERYSYKLGSAIPNPDLKPEYSIHYQLGYSTNIIKGLHTDVSLFESQLYNVIQSVTQVGPNGESQSRNTGRARYAGYEYDTTSKWALPAPEASVEYTLPFKTEFLNSLSLWANGSYITCRNLTTPSLLFVDEPKSQMRGGVDYKPFSMLRLSFDTQYESGRISSSSGLWRTSAFTLFNARCAIDVKWFTINAGCTNISDVNYSYTEGYPEEGRAMYAELCFNLKK
jgi:iron complex outermembrane receptor protein